MRVATLSLLTVLALGSPTLAAEAKPKVYVILWFDTEDYLLPASDDAALRVADFLTRRGIRATFKIVGHKARTLEQRKRFDVIEALKKHEIGYHTNWHSTQPSPAMYAENLDWDEGLAEFLRREQSGVDDVTRIFGVAPSCYGQPGSSWCPQSYGACKQWDMIYLDAGRHVALDGLPCYYCGVFNLYQLTHLMRADLNKPELLEEANKRFAEARQKILADGGGVVSIVYHPCEWVHKQFWDGVNFERGANPPPSKWKLPPQKSEEESRLSYRIFADYVAFMKRFNDVEFITASEAAKMYADRARGKRFDADELRAVAQEVRKGITFQRRGEIFDLLTRFVDRRLDDKKTDSVTLNGTPLGPTSRVVELTEAITTDDSQFTRTCSDVVDYVKQHGRLPGAVWLGSAAVPPEAFLRTVAEMTLKLLDGESLPESIEIQPAKLVAEKYVSKDDPRLWGWVIFPPGMKAPRMMDLARRQAWTLKPAVLVNR